MKEFSNEELADIATAVYRLISDLPFADACKVINAVVTAKTEASTVDLPLDGNAESMCRRMKVAECRIHVGDSIF